MNANYISIEEVKNAAELKGTSFADYDIGLAISAASTGIDQYTGRRFDSDTSATVVRYYTPQENRYVNIDDVVSVGAISGATVAVDLTSTGTYTTLTLNTDYKLEPLNAAADIWPYETVRMMPLSNYWLPQNPGSVKVTAQFGWPGGVPDNVRDATLVVATRLLKRGREAPFGVVGLGIDQTAVRISRTDPDVCFLLDNWIRGNQVLAA